MSRYFSPLGSKFHAVLDNHVGALRGHRDTGPSRSMDFTLLTPSALRSLVAQNKLKDNLLAKCEAITQLVCFLSHIYTYVHYFLFICLSFLCFTVFSALNFLYFSVLSLCCVMLHSLNVTLLILKKLEFQLCRLSIVNTNYLQVGNFLAYNEYNC